MFKSPPTMLRIQHRRPPPRTLVWLWLLAAMFVLQGAVPLLATVAAGKQGVALADVCSVYGVRTGMADPGPSSKDGSPLSGQHAGDTHCALTFLLGSPALAMPAAAVHLHAPQQAAGHQGSAPRALPVDAIRRWLAGRLHAPPVPV